MVQNGQVVLDCGDKLENFNEEINYIFLFDSFSSIKFFIDNIEDCFEEAIIYNNGKKQT